MERSVKIPGAKSPEQSGLMVRRWPVNGAMDGEGGSAGARERERSLE
jgi:hypothetical protein